MSVQTFQFPDRFPNFWTLFFSPDTYEAEAAFRSRLAHTARLGVLLAGLVGLFGVGLYSLVSLLTGKTATWALASPVSSNALLLSHNGVIVGLCISLMLLSQRDISLTVSASP